MRREFEELLLRMHQENIAQFRAIIVNQDGKLWGEVFHSPRVPLNIHSCSKSFVSTAIGFAVEEGILTLEDKVVDAFVEYLPADVGDWLGDLSLRHLLKMSSGHAQENFMNRWFVGKTDWLKQYLYQPIVCEPGSRFWYESGDTYLAGAMLQKKVGMTLVDYLKSRLFDPLQIETPFWQTSPEGYNIGWTGLWLKTEDLLKWAELFRNKGNWYGRQLISTEWVEEATSNLIRTDDNHLNYGKEALGYGYQIWRCPEDGFRAAGMGGQYSIAIPKYNACIAFSSFDLPKMHLALDIVWDVIVPALA